MIFRLRYLVEIVEEKVWGLDGGWVGMDLGRGFFGYIGYGWFFFFSVLVFFVFFVILNFYFVFRYSCFYSSFFLLVLVNFSVRFMLGVFSFN